MDVLIACSSYKEKYSTPPYMSQMNILHPQKTHDTPPKFNVASEKWLLEDYLPFGSLLGWPTFRGEVLNFPGAAQSFEGRACIAGKDIQFGMRFPCRRTFQPGFSFHPGAGFNARGNKILPCSSSHTCWVVRSFRVGFWGSCHTS